MKILYVTPFFPYPPVAGGLVRMWNFIIRLAKRHRVDLLSFVEEGVPPAEVEPVKAYCPRVETVVRSYAPYPRRFGEAVPQIVKDFYHPGMVETMLGMLAEERYDLVQVEFTHMGEYAPLARGIPCVITEHDIAFESLRRQAAQAPWRGHKASLYWEYLKMLVFETRACEAAAGVIAVSDRDCARLRGFAPKARVFPVPTGVDTAFYSLGDGLRNPDEVLFIGHMGHPPNIDGLVWFYRQVFGQLVRLRPQVRLTVVGNRMEEDFPRLAPETAQEMRRDPRVDLVGRVPDTRPHMDRAGAMAVPIRVGAGVRVKLFEAFAAGIPVVSTALGAEGIPVRDGVHLRLADKPEAFARAVVEVLSNPEQATGMVRQARTLVEERFDYGPLADQLARVYDQVISGGSGYK